MKKQFLSVLVLGFLLGSLTSPLFTEHNLAELLLGDGTFPSLRIPREVDPIHLKANGRRTGIGRCVRIAPKGNAVAFSLSVQKAADGVRLAFRSTVCTECGASA